MEAIIDDVENGARVEYRAGFLDPDERAALRAELDALRAHFDHDVLRVYGRDVPSPRLVCAFGDDSSRYRYSTVDRPTHPWPPHLRRARDRIAEIAGHPLTHGLVNLYRDGGDRIGWHADDVSDLVLGTCIASLSLGAERPFQLRRKRTGSEIHEVSLADGSLLLMKGTTQRLYKHQLPARRRIASPRLNVTFRCVRAD